MAPHSLKRNNIISLLLKKVVQYSREEGGTALLHRYVNSVSLRDGATALHYAARIGDELTCSMLLQRGGNVNIRMQDTHAHSPTVLYLAVQSGNIKLVALLLLHGADPNDGLSPPSNVTPMLAAIDKGNTKIAIMLLNGVDNEDESLRQKKADPNKGVGNGGGSASGIMQSPLLYAVVRGRADIVHELLTAGAFCNIIVATPSSPAGETIVEIARKKRDFDVLQALMAFRKCHPEIVRGEL
jgi:ankyrin repeat protein